MSDKCCPKCGAAESTETYSQHDGWCGFYSCGSEQNYRRGFHQSDRCRVLELEAKLATEIADWAETDTHIRNVARPVLGAWVDGDSDSVPSVGDIVERLVSEDERLRRGLAKLDGADYREEHMRANLTPDELRDILWVMSIENAAWKSALSELQAENERLRAVIHGLIEVSKYMREEYSDMDDAVTYARAAIDAAKEKP